MSLWEAVMTSNLTADDLWVPKSKHLERLPRNNTFQISPHIILKYDTRPVLESRQSSTSHF